MSRQEYIACRKNATIYQGFFDSAAKYRDNVAFYFQFKKFSYKHVIKNVNKFARALLDLGIKENDVVTFCLPNIPEAVYLLLSINQIGAIANIVHPLFNGEQMEENLTMTGSKLLFCLDSHYHKFMSLEKKGIKIFACSPTRELSLTKKIFYRLMNKKIKLVKKTAKLNYFYKKEPYYFYNKDYKKDAFYLHSGGTSGKSKTVALSSFCIMALCSNGPYILDIESAEGKGMLAVLPMFHAFGLAMGVLIIMMHGGAAVLMAKFSARQTIKYLKKKYLNYLVGVPTLYESLLSKKNFRGKKLKNLEIAFIGGDFVSSSLLDRFNTKLISAGTIGRLLEGYGLTETCSVASVNFLRNARRGTVGQPLPNVKYKIVDPDTLEDLGRNKEGELLIGGETIMNGYRFAPEADANERVFVHDKDGTTYIRTGDCCLLDDDNYLVYKQRLKTIIKVNGVPVFPSNIEDAVISTGLVYECAAIGVEDAKRGHMVKLFVVLKRGLEKEHTQNVEQLFNESIVGKCGIYAKPKEIVFVKALPHTMIGKIDVKKLS